jgi:hypothetical protein
MPHAVLKLVGGVNSQETPALNENGQISSSSNIRFMADPQGLVLAQKLGGYSKFYGSSMPAIVRALWAWEDLNDNSWLAVGTQTGSNGALLAAITGGVLQTITPTYTTTTAAPVMSTTSGSAIVTITDTNTTSVTNFDSVFIATPVSIGGLILYGMYPCDPNGFAGTTTYTIQAHDLLGNAQAATATSTSPVLPQFTTIAGASTVTVTLPSYTYAVGNTFPVLTPTTVGGITLYGNYVVTQLVSGTQFNIQASSKATSSASAYLNSGNAAYVYALGQGYAGAGTGFGVGAFGSGGFGSGTAPTPPVGTNLDAVDWTMDNWGDTLVACADRNQGPEPIPFQPIWVWEPGFAQASVLSNAPTVNDGIFVAMPQRQIVAWGSTETGIQDPLLICWCDVNNFNQWIGLATNQAGNYRIPKGSRIVGAVQGAQQGLIWTDVDLWSMVYTGTPYIYSFTEIGSGCGLIARKAAAAWNGAYYWMGPSQFYMLGASGVVPLPCPVWDVVYQNLDQNNLYKIRCAVNSRFNEITWYYPSITGGTGENDSYVKYNAQLGLWDYGPSDITAWVDQTVLGPPIASHLMGNLLQQHEISNDADGQPLVSWFQTGYYTLGEGDFKTFVDLVWPDMKWGQVSQSQTANVQISFYVVNYPGDTPTIYGPYTVTQATKFFNTRLRGRLISIRVGSSDLGSFWRIGAMRYRWAQDGKFG